jgi:hypothetical protein
MLDITHKTPWLSRKQCRALVGALLIAVVACLAMSVGLSFLSEKTDLHTTQSGVRTLPEDVESVLTSFTYSQESEDGKMAISGKRVVRRGRRLLGLRSNLVKMNFIEEIKGTLRTPKGTTRFAASDAEWDADSSRPLLLKRDVSVTVNGESLTQVKNAKIYLKRGVMEVNDGRQSYLLK